MMFRAFAISVGLLACSAGVAMAADPVVYTPAAPGVVTDSSGFDWDGFYIGVGGTAILYQGPIQWGGVTIDAGANFTADNVLFGLEGSVGAARDSLGNSGFVATGEGRVGYLIAPEVLAYGAVGATYHTLAPGTWLNAGGGLEFAVADSMSIDVEYKYHYGLGGLVSGNGVSASLLWHFN